MRPALGFLGLLFALGGIPVLSASGQESVLPEGVRAVWDLNKAYREGTSTRERICLNGLWQWQPAEVNADTVPSEGWGYFKVPGPWPGITDYMQKDCQTVHVHPRWQQVRLREISAAWYQRTFSVPNDWQGRDILLQADYVNSLAVVFIDNQKIGEIVFPGGELNLTDVCAPGRTYTLSILVAALPLKGVMLAYTDSNAARQIRGSVARRGLCGDVFLVARPRGTTIQHARLESSYREKTVRVVAQLAQIDLHRRYCLRLTVLDNGQPVLESTSPPQTGAEIQGGHFISKIDWMPPKLWDIHTPHHQYIVRVAVLDEMGNVLDEFWPIRWGFREFWIEGRDFYLNGTRIFLSAVPLDNAQVGAAWCTYEAACESLRRLKSFGINFVYTHNYDCLPGSHLSFEDILRAADDVGMLVALTQPHFAHYDWQSPDAESRNGYREHALFYVRVAGSHPSVVMYSTSHNATGYAEDMNPDLIDGIHDPRDGWSLNNARRALRAEEVIRSLDPSRVIYHHSSGNLGSMHTSNFYPNWVPIQELCDWFEHWSRAGVKPFFACEYGAPFTWDWAMYRGWYKGQREFGSAVVPWDFCLAEWNAQFLGDQAYAISEQEKRNLRWEARQFREGRLWHRWDYPHQLGSSDFDERYPILERYLEDAWRAFRTWEVSAISPWEHHILWKMRPGLVRNSQTQLQTDWDNLQRPGYSPDFLRERYERMDLAYEQDDWIPTLAARAMYRNNMPLLAYLAGSPAAVTERGHNYYPGEQLEKQLVIINNSRQTVRCHWRWQLSRAEDSQNGSRSGLQNPILAEGTGERQIPTGQQSRELLQVALPEQLAPGRYVLATECQFDSGETQRDRLDIHILPRPDWPALLERFKARSTRIGLFDPVGETRSLLERLGIPFQTTTAQDDVRAFDVLIIGKKALTTHGPAPSITAVREGLKVLVFEQTGEVLEKRLGFRISEYGLRNAFCRIPDHPCLTGLSDEHLRDWRGEASLLPPRLEYTPSDRYAGSPTVRWCGLEVPRLWRCGNRGSVASVLLEKPSVGDFLPIVDGGFSLQYSPLLEYREGQGLVLFCQLDVTGRSEVEPAAEHLLHGMLSYLCHLDRRPPQKRLLVAGDEGLKRYLSQLGIVFSEYQNQPLGEDDVLIITSQVSDSLKPRREKLSQWLSAGGQLLLLEMDGDEISALLPISVATQSGEYINAVFRRPSTGSIFAGVSPADIHNRDPRTLPLITQGAETLGGVLAQMLNGHVVMCQLLPYRFLASPADVPQVETTDEDRFEGKTCARVTLASVPWAQFGQKIAAGAAGKTFTLSAWVKPLDKPTTVRLEVERAGSPYNRLVRGPDEVVPPGEWKQLQVTFTPQQHYPEGWQAYLHVGQPETRILVDDFVLHEVATTTANEPSSSESGKETNLLVNGGFEEGTHPWYFNWTTEQQNLRKTFRRTAFMFSRLLGNLGIRPGTPLLERFEQPVSDGSGQSQVFNGDFSIDDNQDGIPDGWTFSCEAPQGRCTRLSEGPVPEKPAVQMELPPGTSERRVTVMLSQLGVPIQRSQWYRVSFFARGEELTARQATFAVQDTKRWQPLLDYVRFSPPSQWKHFSYLLQGKETEMKNTRLQIWFEGSGRLALADVQIIPCDPPTEGRWKSGLYLDTPQEWDDPYRFFRW